MAEAAKDLVDGGFDDCIFGGSAVQHYGICDHPAQPVPVVPGIELEHARR